MAQYSKLIREANLETLGHHVTVSPVVSLEKNCAA